MASLSHQSCRDSGRKTMVSHHLFDLWLLSFDFNDELITHKHTPMLTRREEEGKWNNICPWTNFGPEYLLKLYLAGAIGGSVFYLVHHAFMAASSKGQGMWTRDPSRTPGLGASGAVNAIMLLDIFLNPGATSYFDFIIPVPAMILGIFLIGKDILRIIEGNSNISGSAHLGGAAVAAIAWKRIRKGHFWVLN